MSYASVDLEALASLVTTVRDAGESIPTDHTTITDALDGGPVSVAALAAAPDIAAWLEQQHATLSSQLGYARWLDASTPGIQRTVTFEEGSVPLISEAQAKALAEQALALMQPGEPPSAELNDLLEQYGGNPQFALFLMHGYREGEGYAGMTLGPQPDLDYLTNLTEGPESERFLQLYSQALGGLSHEFDFPGAGEALGDSNPDGYRAWALLASRGDWDASWLTGLGQDLIDAERADPELWTKDLWGGDADGSYDTVQGFTDPQGLQVQDPMVWLMDALSRNPEAAAGLFGGGGEAPIKSDGDEVDIAANLRWLTLERPWEQDHGLSLSLALGAADSLEDPDFSRDFDALQHLDPVEKASWYSFAAHLGLDIIGLVPVLGEWADGINVSLSLAEGDYVGAGVSAAGAVPVFGSTATIGKWIKRLNDAADAAGAVLTVDNLRQLLSELDQTDQDPAAVPEPVTDPTFVTGSEDSPWYEHLGQPGHDEVYVVPGGVVLRTDSHGQITDVEGDVTALDPGAQSWIEEHRGED